MIFTLFCDFNSSCEFLPRLWFLTRHFEFLLYVVILTHLVSFYHIYDFNSSFEFLPYFVIWTLLLSFYHTYDFHLSFKLLPFAFLSRLWFELVAIFQILPFVIELSFDTLSNFEKRDGWTCLIISCIPHMWGNYKETAN